MPLTFQSKSEELVYRICKKSFLSLWSHPNPEGKAKGKELCDTLILCGNDIIIISVKESKPKDSGSIQLDWERWSKVVIDESAKQLFGAERWLNSQTSFVTPGGRTLELPPLRDRRLHRVALALGNDGRMPHESGRDFGKGFVHVFDEMSFNVAMSELDTISDFVEYLREKEKFIAEGGTIEMEGGEESLIAHYVTNSRSFPSGAISFIVGANIWRELSNLEQHRLKKQADTKSYAWDTLIEWLTDDLLQDR